MVLGKPYRCVVFRVGKEHDPFVADELVEIDGAVGGLSLEVRRNGPKTEPTSGEFEAIMDSMFQAQSSGGGLTAPHVDLANPYCVEGRVVVFV